MRAPLSRTTEAGGGAGTTVPPRPACPPALPRAQSPGRPHRGTRDPLNPVTRRRSSQLPSHCFARTWDALRLCLRVPWSQNKPEAPTSPGPEPSLLPVLTTDPGRTEKHGPSLGSDPREDPWLPRQQWNPRRCLIKLRPPTAPLPAGGGEGVQRRHRGRRQARPAARSLSTRSQAPTALPPAEGSWPQPPASLAGPSVPQVLVTPDQLACLLQGRRLARSVQVGRDGGTRSRPSVAGGPDWKRRRGEGTRTGCREGVSPEDGSAPPSLPLPQGLNGPAQETSRPIWVQGPPRGLLRSRYPPCWGNSRGPPVPRTTRLLGKPPQPDGLSHLPSHRVWRLRWPGCASHGAAGPGPREASGRSWGPVWREA